MRQLRSVALAAALIAAVAPLFVDGDPRRAEHDILDGIRAESRERAR